jgi:hypothetical protein
MMVHACGCEFLGGASRGRRFLSILAFLAVAAFLPNGAQALVVGLAAGDIDFSTAAKAAGGGGAPVFGAADNLIDPGGGYPSWPGGVVFKSTAGAISPGILASTVPPAVAQPAAYLAGGMSEFAVGFPGGGAVVYPGFYTFQNPAVANVAAITDGYTLASFNGAFTGTTGAYLSVAGIVPLGSVVAASLAGTIDGVAFDPIVIRSDGAGALADGVVFAGANDPIHLSGFAGAGTAFFTAYGVDLDPNQALGAGPHIVAGTLSLIVDPGASVDFFPLPNGIETPDLGAGTAPIPEPATMTLLGAGLIGLIVARRRKIR